MSSVHTHSTSSTFSVLDGSSSGISAATIEFRGEDRVLVNAQGVLKQLFATAIACTAIVELLLQWITAC